MQEMNNYKKEKLTINLVWANIFGILLFIPVILVFGLPYYLLWGNNMGINEIKELLTPFNSFYVLGVLILGIIIHELIHGIFFAMYAKQGLKSIKFGVLWNMLTPYCHCKEPLKVKHYMVGGIMPAIILGIIPSLVAIIIGNLPLLLFGILFTVAAAGDFLIINLIRKENKSDLVQDHPSEAGCYIYRKNKNNL